MPARIQCNRCAQYFPDNVDGAVHIASCREHNGWTNYETWLVALWLDNECSTHEYWHAVADEVACDEAARAADGDKGPAIRRLADMLRAELEEAAELRLDGRTDMFSDLLSSALSEVSWTEIAEHFIAE